MKTNIALLNRAGRWFGTGYMMNPKSLFRRLAGTLPGVLLWLAVLPLAAFGQANYPTPYTFTTLAGLAVVAGSADGTNGAARFNGPGGVAVDTNGNVYVADFGNDTIREVTPVGTNWVVTTLAGLAGSPGSANGAGSAARFNGPNGVAVDSAGNLYVADSGNNTIREVTPVGTNWVVTTLAGGLVPGSADGTNSAARFNYPCTVTLDTNGNLYVADSGNDTIRKMTPVGTNWVVTTLAGLAGSAGRADGTNSAARFNYPYGLALDSAGNIYLGDAQNNTVRKVTPVGTNWVVTTLAGLAGSPGCADGTNSAARFFVVGGGAVDSAGNVYVVDYYNATIREVSPVGTNWVVTTVAGIAGWDGSTDGTGSDASFNNPNGIVMDSAGNLYVPDYGNDTIRKGFPASSIPPATSAPPVTVYAFLARTYGILPYRLFIPTNYNPALKYPLVLYLHGSDESGTENLAQLRLSQKLFYWMVAKEKGKPVGWTRLRSAAGTIASATTARVDFGFRQMALTLESPFSGL